MARNAVIGRHDDLAWRDRDDLQRVKQLTIGRTLLMGRRTFDSIGRPLPGRRTIVVTRRAHWAPAGVTVANSVGEALTAADGDGEVIGFGGGEIYAQLLDVSDRLEITEIAADLDGDVFFPAFTRDDWIETHRVSRTTFDWVTYQRVRRLEPASSTPAR